MWLIDTKTLCLTDIQQPESVQYAILSHCWRDGQEVSFHEFAHLDPSNTRQKPGFSKIFMTCGFARRHGIPYAWIDTCCIDKSSSAELSEAINSMFRWYQRAKVCFVFLADMPSQTTDISLYLEKCRWFTRGWTLQELIAPEKVEFYDQAWGFIGTKTTLVNSLSDITKISREILQGETDFGTISVAQRMSWAAHRSTTRTEDLAYCLFGISDVHLPLIYGEGHKAFTRLQEAILQNSADLSLFAWTSKCGQKYRGAFAKSPAEFENCKHHLRHTRDYIHPLITSTNRGVEFNDLGDLFIAKRHDGSTAYLMPLQCLIRPPTRSSRSQVNSVAEGWMELTNCGHYFLRQEKDTIHGKHEVDLRRSKRLQGAKVCIPRFVHPSNSKALENKMMAGLDVKITEFADLRLSIGKCFPSHLQQPHRMNEFIVEKDADFHIHFTILLTSNTEGINHITLVGVLFYFRFERRSGGKLSDTLHPAVTLVDSEDTSLDQQLRWGVGGDKNSIDIASGRSTPPTGHSGTPDIRITVRCIEDLPDTKLESYSIEVSATWLSAARGGTTGGEGKKARRPKSTLALRPKSVSTDHKTPAVR